MRLLAGFIKGCGMNVEDYCRMLNGTLPDDMVFNTEKKIKVGTQEKEGRGGE